MANYDLKAYVIQSGLVDECKKIKRSIFCATYGVESHSDILDEDTALYERDFFSQNQPEEWDEAMRVCHAEFKRATRLNSRIAVFMRLGICIFLTLTFTDDVLNKTSVKTRRKYVTRYLKSQSTRYVGNIDFGSKNGREHYHAIVLADKVDYSGWHRYGAINGKQIKSTSSPKALARYISKLTNHAIKETATGHRIIYSKNIFSGVDEEIMALYRRQFQFHDVSSSDECPFIDSTSL